MGRRTDRRTVLMILPLVSILLLSGLSMAVYFTLHGRWMQALFAGVETQRRESLVQVVSVARNAIEPLLARVRSRQLDPGAALDMVRSLVRTMTYRDQYGDNYVFMSAYDGTMLVQPFEPDMEMTSQWELRDAHGKYIIRELVKAAQANPAGSFVSYDYHLPGVHEEQEKLAYVVGVPELSCYIGTGMYMQEAIAGQREVLESIRTSSLWLLLAVFIPAAVSLLFIGNRNRLLLVEIGIRKEAEEKFRSIFENAVEGIFQISPEGRFLSANPSMARMAGFGSPRGLIDGVGSIGDYYADPADRESLLRTLAERGAVTDFITMLKRRDGTPVWVSMNAHAVKDADGRLLYFEGTLVDITERRRAEEASRQYEEKLATVFMTTPDFIVISRVSDGLIKDTNRGFEEITGWRREEALGRTSLELGIWVDPAEREHMVAELNAGRDVLAQEFRFRKKDGTVRIGMYSARSIQADGESCLIFVMQDITEHQREEEERDRLQAQLQQAQKMESVGRLAGGVAHDFNNMLSVIMGHADMALEMMDPSSPLREDLEEIRGAARRSSDLTRQLLAFARRQTIAPRVLDLNDTIAGMLKMLARLIGEDISLQWAPGKGLWPVKIDPAQLDQVMANLCVNARDAISGVGVVTIETRNVVVDGRDSPALAGILPGDYVLLTVRDNGSGMTADVLEHLFEPFFTTKPVGKGTGLGLATMYGIVTQNNGFIHAESEPGKGTVFSIHLPRAAGGTVKAAGSAPDDSWRANGEVVLLVEDEASILAMGREMLTKLGCTVLAAPSAREAIRVAEARAGEIRLLITDVIMPEMNGRELAERLRRGKPGLRCLFMSGYTADVMATHGILEAGVHFIQKPFSFRELAEKLREALADAAPQSGRGDGG